MPSGKFDSTNQKHYPDLSSDASSVWNFCARFSDVICGGKPVVASPKVCCFLRLGILLLLYLCMAVKRGKEGSSDSHIKRTGILVRKLEVGPSKLRINLSAAQVLLEPKRSSSIKKVMTNLCSNHFSRQNGLRPVRSEVNEFRACNSRRACITVGGRNLEYILGWFPPVTWHQNQTNKKKPQQLLTFIYRLLHFQNAVNLDSFQY